MLVILASHTRVNAHKYLNLKFINFITNRKWSKDDWKLRINVAGKWPLKQCVSMCVHVVQSR